ncbi:FUSC family membrane protein, partial [Nonomuraea sp. NPDC049784]|uniref:FUSC family membrane protein n=1 Tax=Nonomuraea sp. NPDC049784 TaxID=3154361 RepID=UPI003409D16A
MSTDPQRKRPHRARRLTGRRLTPARWRSLLRGGPFHWDAVAPGRAARVASGVVVPLAAGAAGGQLEYGAFAALGAQPAGFVSFHGVARTRVAAVAAASIGMAVSTFVGAATAAAAPWLLVPAVMLWGYVTGLAVCLGPRMSVVVLQWSVALMIAVGIPLGPSEAALRAGLVLAGGLFQGALVALSWTLRRGTTERTALAESYRDLASYARGLAAGRFDPPPPTAFPATALLADPNPLLPQAVRMDYLDLLELAERIRASLAALAEHAPDDPSGAARGFAADTARALDAVAGALSARQADRAALVRELCRLLPAPVVAPDTRWEWTAEAVLGQLRAVGGILTRLDAVSVRATAESRPGGPATVPVAQDEITWTALTVRANLTPTGETGRHAVRLAVAAGLAE